MGGVAWSRGQMSSAAQALTRMLRAEQRREVLSRVDLAIDGVTPASGDRDRRDAAERVCQILKRARPDPFLFAAAISKAEAATGYSAEALSEVFDAPRKWRVTTAVFVTAGSPVTLKIEQSADGSTWSHHEAIELPSGVTLRFRVERKTEGRHR